MTVKELSIAFVYKLPIVLAMPNKPIIKYREILYIEYSRTKKGSARVNAALIDAKTKNSFTVARLKYIERCPNDFPDDSDGTEYSFNTDDEDYENTPPISIDKDIKEAFERILPVVVSVKANKLSVEVQKRLIGSVIGNKELKLKFPYIQRLKIYLDENREPILYCDFDLGIDIPIKDIKIFKSRREYYEFHSD